MAKGLPQRQFMLLKAESLTNDGTALVVYGTAVGLALGGSYTAWDITLTAAISFGGGILVGVAIAAIAVPALSRLTDPLVINMALIVTPFAAYLIAEELEASAVLAVVVAGLIISALSDRASTPVSRTQAEHFWPLATGLLNGTLFVLIGLETRVLVQRFRPEEVFGLAGIAVVVALSLVVSRFVFLQLSVWLIRSLDRRPEQRARRMSYRARVVSAMAAFRGAVSLAIALSIPLTLNDGTAFPQRDQVILVAALTIVLGMTVQAPLLPRVIAWAARGDSGDRAEAELTQEQHLNDAQALIWAALRPELPALAEEAEVPPRFAARMLNRLDEKAAQAGSDGEDPDEMATRAALERMHGAMLGRKREILRQLNREGRISDEIARILRARLDLEEIRRDGYLPFE